MLLVTNYQRRYERNQEIGKGLGATFEGVIVTQRLYESEGQIFGRWSSERGQRTLHPYRATSQKCLFCKDFRSPKKIPFSNMIKLIFVLEKK